MCSIGDYLAIASSPAITGSYAASLTAGVAALRGLPIQEVMEHANRAAFFGTLAFVPASGIGVILALIFCRG
jgi:hypothetical protein